MRQEPIELWREALGDDAERIWNSLPEDAAPPLRHTFRDETRRHPQRWLMAAAIAIVAATAVWNFSLMRQLADLREDYVLATLSPGSPATRLTALHRLDGSTLSADAVVALKDIVRTSQDPNIQLAALDVLLDGGALSGDAEIQTLIEQVRHNGRFIQAAVRSRSIRTQEI